jgi:hypothetical protein
MLSAGLFTPFYDSLNLGTGWLNRSFFLHKEVYIDVIGKGDGVLYPGWENLFNQIHKIH